MEENQDKMKINVLYAIVANMFLKEANLLSYWKEYIASDDRFDCRHWSNTKYITDVFGKTCFSDFIIGKLKNYNGKEAYTIGEASSDSCFIYELFGYWICKKYPSLVSYISPYLLTEIGFNGEKYYQENIIIEKKITRLKIRDRKGNYFEIV